MLCPPALARNVSVFMKWSTKQRVLPLARIAHPLTGERRRGTVSGSVCYSKGRLAGCTRDLFKAALGLGEKGTTGQQMSVVQRTHAAVVPERGQRSITSNSSSRWMGLEMYSSIPTLRQRSRSPFMA